MLVKDKIIKVKKESVLICLDGSPVVENQEMSVFDYGKLDPDEEYEVDTTDGVLAMFTRN